MTQNELMHYGKLGMKWGRRKSPEISTEHLKTGKSLIKETQGVVNGATRINNAVATSRTQKAKRKSAESKPKNLNTMSDRELQQKVQRLNMERQFSDLTRQPQQVSRGQENLKTTLEVAGGVLTTVGSVVSIALAIKQLSGN